MKMTELLPLKVYLFTLRYLLFYHYIFSFSCLEPGIGPDCLISETKKIYILNKRKNLRFTIFYPKIVFIKKKEIIFLHHGRTKFKILLMKQFSGCLLCNKG